jgi:hypothetical protein
MFIARRYAHIHSAVRRTGKWHSVKLLLRSRSSERRRKEGIVAGYKHLTPLGWRVECRHACA